MCIVLNTSFMLSANDHGLTPHPQLNNCDIISFLCVSLYTLLAKDFCSSSQLSNKQHIIAWSGHTSQPKGHKLRSLPSSAAYSIEWPLPFHGPCLPPSPQGSSELLLQELGEWQKGTASMQAMVSPVSLWQATRQAQRACAWKQTPETPWRKTKTPV